MDYYEKFMENHIFKYLTSFYIASLLLSIVVSGFRYDYFLFYTFFLFLLLVSIAFSYGMSMITELTLGSLNGEAILDVTIPNGETICMLSNWGLGLGFYLCIISSIILIVAGIIDYLRMKKWPKEIFKNI